MAHLPPPLALQFQAQGHGCLGETHPLHGHSMLKDALRDALAQRGSEE